LQNGIELDERDIFSAPLSESEILGIVKYTDIDYIFAKRSPSVKKMGLNIDTMSDQDKISNMVKEPRLIRRPMIVDGIKVLVGADVKKWIS
tara:strand:- start:11927 stop:12199 length:273 start_codon:yes stop_codon:yes gene_type:complete